MMSEYTQSQVIEEGGEEDCEDYVEVLGTVVTVTNDDDRDYYKCQESA